MGDTYNENTGAYGNLRDKKKGPPAYSGDSAHTGSREGGGSSSGGGGGGGGNGKDPGVWKPDRGNDDEITGGGSTTTGGGYSTGGYGYSSSGGSYGSSGSSGSSMSIRDSRLISQAESLYYQLWGEYPATGYAKALVKKGLNIFEIEDHERRKPAFKKTDTYQDEYMAYAKMVSRIMGTR